MHQLLLNGSLVIALVSAVAIIGVCVGLDFRRLSDERRDAVVFTLLATVALCIGSTIVYTVAVLRADPESVIFTDIMTDWLADEERIDALDQAQGHALTADHDISQSGARV